MTSFTRDDMEAAGEILDFLDYDGIPEGAVREVSKAFNDLAYMIYAWLGSSRETTAGLRKILEARDCFVRLAELQSLTPEPAPQVGSEEPPGAQ